MLHRDGILAVEMLKFNTAKCSVIRFDYGTPRHNYFLGKIMLQEVTEGKDLGIYLTENGKPSIQCTEAARKASYICML